MLLFMVFFRNGSSEELFIYTERYVAVVISLNCCEKLMSSFGHTAPYFLQIQMARGEQEKILCKP